MSKCCPERKKNKETETGNTGDINAKKLNLESYTKFELNVR